MSRKRNLRKLFGRSARRNRSRKSTRSRKTNSLSFESLEDRRLLALLGLTIEEPTMSANSLTGDPGVTYNATTDLFTAQATPISFLSSAVPFPVAISAPESFGINFTVDSAGNFTGGVAGNDFELTGEIDIDLDGTIDVSGVLLTGEVIAFGFEDSGSASSTDSYDVRLQVTGGVLTTSGTLSGGGLRPNYFDGKDVAILIGSENSTFNGSFDVDFVGETKAVFGPIDTITPVFDPAINIVKYVDKVVTESEMTTVNFDSLAAGDTVYDQLPGVVIEAVNARVPGAGNRAMIFDSSPSDGNLTGGDHDLGSPNQAYGGPGVGNGGSTNTVALGNILIISEDGDASDPDDEAQGGTFTFTFDQPVSINYLDLLDIDSNEAGGSVVTLTTAAGTQSFDIPTLGNNSWQRLDIDVDEVTSMEVHFVSSGAISEFKYTTTTSEKQWFDANEAPGIEFGFGETVEFSYHVTNPGDVSLFPVVIVDDNATPEVPGDDFAPIPVEDGGFNVGDEDGDNELDPGEEWIYTFSIIADQVGQFTNIAKVTGTPIDENGEVVGEDVMDDDPANYTVTGVPGISIEKWTNGEDADTPGEAVEIIAGETVTWTYFVTNTGGLPFDQSEVGVVDDNGTPDDTSDDFAPTFDASSDDGSDGVLSPGETWEYTYQDVAGTTGSSGGATSTFYFNANGSLDGPNGNIRNFSTDGISVNVSAFSRDTSGVWSDAYLGIFSGGLGVTDSGEGDGTSGRHRVDNIGRTNYVVFEFSENVVVDRTLLDSVVSDSDLSVWVGTIGDAYNNHVSLTDAVLEGLFNETNNTTSSASRWADINNGEIVGNFLVLAASVEDTTPEDQFKIRKVEFQSVVDDVYGNIGTVTAGDVDDTDPSHYRNPVGDPGISIEKWTNGVDADLPSEAVEIVAGETVTWTYWVENTGTLPFSESQVSVVDDNGTPGNIHDDFEPMLIESSDAGSDGILSPGEIWEYFAEGVAETTGTYSETSTLYFNGNSSLDGPNGNVRSFSVDGVDVNASAFSRTTSGTWNDAYLGIFSGGLGVTDSSEGNGGNGLHRVDNVGRTNYVVMTFSEAVVVDRALLDSVSGDSDLSVWIGNIDGAFNNGVSMSDATLAGLVNEVDNTTSSSARWANFNDGEVAGNVLVLAASVEDTTPDDRFKIRKVQFRQFNAEVYGNVGSVNAGDVQDTDLSHYRNPGAMDIMFEAEDFEWKDHPWSVYNSSAASGGQYIKAPNGSGNYYNSPGSHNSVKYQFNVDHSGTYSLSGLVRASDGADNSVWVRVNNGAWVQWHMDVTGSEFQWQTVTDGFDQLDTDFHLDAGNNMLEISLREDGTKIDKFMVSKI